MHNFFIIPWHKPFSESSSPTINSKRGKASCGLALLRPLSPASPPASSDLTLYLHSRNSRELLSLGMQWWGLRCDVSLCHPFSLECSFCLFCLCSHSGVSSSRRSFQMPMARDNAPHPPPPGQTSWVHQWPWNPGMVKDTDLRPRLPGVQSQLILGRGLTQVFLSVRWGLPGLASWDCYED